MAGATDGVWARVWSGRDVLTVRMFLARRGWVRLILLLGALFIGARLSIGVVGCYPHHRLDGLGSCLLPAVFQEDTEYAPGYSSQSFEKIRMGMSSGEVLTLLGPPLDRYLVAESREGWRWTRSPGDRSYRIRVVIFEGGRVTEIRHKFYVD